MHTCWACVSTLHNESSSDHSDVGQGPGLCKLRGPSKSSFHNVHTEWLPDIYYLYELERDTQYSLRGQYPEEARHFTMTLVSSPGAMWLRRIPSVDLCPLHTYVMHLHAYVHVYMCTHTHTVFTSGSWSFTNHLLEVYVPATELVMPGAEVFHLVDPSSQRQQNPPRFHLSWIGKLVPEMVSATDAVPSLQNSVHWIFQEHFVKMETFCSLELGLHSPS